MLNLLALLSDEQLFSLIANPWLGAAAATLALVVVAVFAWRRRRTPGVASAASRGSTHQPQGLFGSLTDALAAQLPESQKEKKDFAQLMRQAGLYSRTSRASIYALRFVLFFVPLAVAGALAIAADSQYTISIMIGGGVAAAALSIIPRLFVFYRRCQRLRQIRNGLADMMDMLSMCLGGGMPLSPSLDHVARNLTQFPALGAELQILKRQAEVGSLKTALTDLANRIDIPEVRQVAGLLMRGEQLGTRLSKSLLDQADHYRATRRQLATMYANKTPVYMTLPLMFCFAPAVLILLMSPAMLELTDFLNPPDGQSVLAGNQSLGASSITRSIGELDQNVILSDAELNP